MSREIKFRIWNTTGKCMHEWRELVEKNKIHLLENQQCAYPVMQYTGLKDVHGVEIYEGDIVMIEGFGSYVIEYNAPSFSLRLIGPCYELWMVDIELGECNCTVIGNIYQNPELMNDI